METSTTWKPCSARMICHCLQVTEERILEVLEVCQLRSVKEVRQHTGAGDGCTACHKRLRALVERQAIALPMVQSAASS